MGKFKLTVNNGQKVTWNGAHHFLPKWLKSGYEGALKKCKPSSALKAAPLLDNYYVGWRLQHNQNYDYYDNYHYYYYVCNELPISLILSATS